MAHGELAWLSLEPDTGLDNCPRILLSCFRARTSVCSAAIFSHKVDGDGKLHRNAREIENENDLSVLGQKRNVSPSSKAH